MQLLVSISFSAADSTIYKILQRAAVFPLCELLAAGVHRQLQLPSPVVGLLFRMSQRRESATHNWLREEGQTAFCPQCNLIQPNCFKCSACEQRRCALHAVKYYQWMDDVKCPDLGDTVEQIADDMKFLIKL